MYNNRNIVLNELIGLRARVVSCFDKRQRGLDGIVVDETKNTLVLKTRAGTRRVVKKTATFKFYADKKAYVVNGVEINYRPSERIEKSMKYYRRRAD